MAKTDVEINLSDVLVHLRNSGAFRAAVMQVAQAKAPGADIGTITLNRDGGELSDQDLKAVTGGIVANRVGTIPRTSQFKFETRAMGFADTTW